MATYTSLLAKIDTAIESLLDGNHESYSLEGRTVTRLDLETLLARRERIAALAARETNGGIRLAKLKRPRS